MFRIGSGARPWALRFRSSKQFILASVLFAVFTDTFLYSLIIPVVPFSLELRVGVAPEDVGKWVSVLIAVYGAAIVVLSPFLGWLADRAQTRSFPLLVGLLFLAGATILLHLSRTIPLLIVARLVQGGSAAVVWIVGLALLADTVEENEVGQYMGHAFVATSIGVLAGPLLGGILFARVNYDAVFAVAYAVVGIDIVLRFLLIEKKTARRWLDDPVPSATEQAEARTEALDEAHIDEKLPDRGTSQTDQIVLENSKPKSSPMRILLSSMRLIASLYGIVVSAALVTAYEASLTLYVKNIWDWTSEGAALLFLPMLVPSLLGPVIGWLTDKFGARWIATAGFLLLVPADVCLRFVERNTIEQKVLCCALLVIFGFCINLTMIPQMADITYMVQIKVAKYPSAFGKHGAYARAYGLLNVAYAAGSLIGPLWGGFVYNSAGWGTMTWSLGALSGVSAIPTLIWCGGAIYRDQKSRSK